MSGRWQEIAAALRGEIKTGALQSGDRLPSETELAERWQVCRMTAHRVMDELQREGLVVRKRRAGTVVAPPAAASPTRPSLDSVALLFFHANDFPQADYIQGIRDGLPDETQLLFCDTGNDPLREAQHLERIGSQVSGIVTYPTCAPANTPLYQRLCAAGKPVVCVDRVPAALPVDSVVTDNFGSTRNALQSLVVRGRRRIVFLGYEEEQRDVSSTRERREAYIETLHEAGEDPHRWMHLLSRTLGHDLPRMVDAVQEMLTAMQGWPERPQALFCKDDFVLAATLEACDRVCLSVPEEIEILSFSDYPPMNLRHTLAVHRLAQQSQQMGRLAAERMLARCSDPSLPIESLRVAAAFHPAQLTSAPPTSAPEIVTSEQRGDTLS